MNDKYETLKIWAIRSAVVLALTVVSALIHRYLGVDVPPVPVTVVVQPAPGTDQQPLVTVHSPGK